MAAFYIIAAIAIQAAIVAPTTEEQAVRAADTAFWQAFNACDADAMARYFTDDVEFYHDITGFTRSRTAVVDSLVKGPCGTPDLHLRRSLIENSVTYQRIPSFGAIMAGDQVFYVRHGTGPEKPETTARFMVVWKQAAGRWQMARVVSYDHRAVPYHPSEAAISLSPETLAHYIGRYRTAGFGDIVVTLENGILILRSGNLQVTLAASAPDRFFALDRDLRFVFSGAPQATTVSVEENGVIVATGSRISAPPEDRTHAQDK